jgi:phage protein D
MAAVMGGDVSGLVHPTITLTPIGLPLNPQVEPAIFRVVVDQHMHLPDMFEITLLDDGEIFGQSMLTIGTEVTIKAGPASASMTDQPSTLIVGEITSIEGFFEENESRIVVRGYEKGHRLQRARRTRTFTNVTDADIVNQVASEAQVDTDTVDSPGVTYTYLAQVNQTDWEFLKERARALGYSLSFSEGKLNFKKVPGMGGGGALGAVADAAASMVGLGGAKLTFGDNLMWFRPRLSAANLTPEVEVRLWDPSAAEVVTSTTSITGTNAKLDEDASALAGKFDGGFLGLPFTPPAIPGLPSLGPSASDKAIINVRHPVAWGSNASSAADAVAAGMAEHIGSTFAEAEGGAYGDPAISAGAELDVDGVLSDFNGKWTITQATHKFEDNEGGYFTHFVVSGRHDRSLLGLASVGASQGRDQRIDGFVVGIVTNNNDPDTMGRVKLSFPWLSPAFESDWARVAQVGAGKKWGSCFVPEVGDEVLVGFEFGDVGRPYVVGGLFNGKTDHPLLSSAVKVQGLTAQVVKHGLVSRLGNQIVFEDDEPMPDSPPPSVTASSITIGDKDSKLVILIDKKSGEIQITCDSTMPPGKITIEQKGTGGSISVKAAGDVSIEAAAPGKLSLKGGTGVSLDGGAGMVELKGSMVKLN